MDSVVLFAILFNTVLLAIENPANILPEQTLLVMVTADAVLTVRMLCCSSSVNFWLWSDRQCDRADWFYVGDVYSYHSDGLLGPKQSHR